MDLEGAYAEQLTKLTDAGLSAAADWADINPPGVQLRPPTLSARFGKGYTATWEAWAVTPAVGLSGALRLFGPLIDRIQDALGWAATDIRVDTVLWGDGGELPAMVLTFTEKFYVSKETPNA